MNATEYDFLERRRVKIIYSNKAKNESEILIGYVIQVAHPSEFYATIHIVQNNGEVSCITPRDCNVKDVKITILGWDPKNPIKKEMTEEESRFDLMDMEE